MKNEIEKIMEAEIKASLDEPEPIKEHDWFEDMWVTVYDRTFAAEVKFPAEAEFVVIGRWSESCHPKWVIIVEKGLKTFSEVEQLVVELWLTYGGLGWFILQGDDPRIAQLATKIGLVKDSPNQHSNGML